MAAKTQYTNANSTAIASNAERLRKYGFTGDNIPTELSRPHKNVIQRIPAAAPHAADQIFTSVKADGGCIVEGLLSRDVVDRVNADLDPHLDNWYEGINDPAGPNTAGVVAFHGAKTKRFTNLVTLSKTWREEVVDKDIFYDVLDKFFLEESGAYWQSSGQVIQLGPGAPAQGLHRDGANHMTFWMLGPDGPEYHINFLIALADTTEENGATRCIPGSHKWSLFDLGDPELAIPAFLKKGDALVIDSRILHAGGENKSSDPRRMVAFTFCPGWLTPEEASTLLVPKELAKTLPKRVQRILGFRSQYVKGAAGLWMSNMEEVGQAIGMDGYNKVYGSS